MWWDDPTGANVSATGPRSRFYESAQAMLSANLPQLF